jgi:hypothetical protein
MNNNMIPYSLFSDNRQLYDISHNCKLSRVGVPRFGTAVTVRFFNIECGPDRKGHGALSARAVWQTAHLTERVWQQARLVTTHVWGLSPDVRC